MTGYLYRGSPALIAVNAAILAERKRAAPAPRPVLPCGTYSRYRRHLKAKEPVDEACMLAAAEMRETMRARRRAKKDRA